MQDVKELSVWQKSVALSKEVYAVTRRFPSSEAHGLASQMQRASVSVPSNIAEGRGRGTRKDYRQFVIRARGSATELETQLVLASELGFVERPTADDLLGKTREILRMLNGLIRSLS